jgi:hypothetical protein
LGSDTLRRYTLGDLATSLAEDYHYPLAWVARLPMVRHSRSAGLRTTELALLTVEVPLCIVEHQSSPARSFVKRSCSRMLSGPDLI